MVKYGLDASEVKQVAQRLGVKPQKELGQNILVNPAVVEKVVSLLDPSDRVLEIGGGLGALTLPLGEKAAHLSVVEIDEKLAMILTKRIASVGLDKKIDVIKDDILQTDLNALSFDTIVGSLPYAITSPILHKLVVEEDGKWKQGFFIIQKEVADKIMGGPPKGSYWHHFIHRYYQVEVIISKIKPSSFWPAPGVASGLVYFRRIDGTIRDRITPQAWSDFLHLVFRHPRKQLGAFMDQALLEQAPIETTKRAGELSQDELVELFKKQKTILTP